MVALEWAHVIIGGVSALAGGGAGLIAGVWRVARIEGRLKLSFEQSIRGCELRLEDKVDQVTQSLVLAEIGHSQIQNRPLPDGGFNQPLTTTKRGFRPWPLIWF